MTTIIEHNKMSMSNHEIALALKCASCIFSDPKALEKNKQAHDRQDWAADLVPYCTFAFRRDIDINNRSMASKSIIVHARVMTCHTHTAKEKYKL